MDREDARRLRGPLFLLASSLAHGSQGLPFPPRTQCLSSHPTQQKDRSPPGNEAEVRPEEEWQGRGKGLLSAL